MRNTNYISVFIFIALSLSIASADLTDGLVAHWSFNEGSGTSVYDSANGHTGTIYNATWTGGITGSALNFDGNNDYVRVPNHSDFDFPAGFSLCAWVKPATSYTDGGRILYRYDTTSKDGYFLDHSKNNDGSWAIVAIIDGNDDPCVCSDVHAIADQWTHIAGVREDNGDIKIYIDGVLQSFIGHHTGAIDSSGDLFIGVDLALKFDFMGVIDEIRMYNRPLLYGEVAELAVPEPCTIFLLSIGMSIIFPGRKKRQAR